MKAWAVFGKDGAGNDCLVYDKIRTGTFWPLLTTHEEDRDIMIKRAQEISTANGVSLRAVRFETAEVEQEIRPQRPAGRR